MKIILNNDAFDIMMAYNKSLIKDKPLVKIAADAAPSTAEPMDLDSIKSTADIFPQIRDHYSILDKGQHGDIVLNAERFNKPEFKQGIVSIADKLKAEVSSAPSVQMVDDLIAAFEAYKNAGSVAAGSAPQTPDVAPKAKRGRPAKPAVDFVSRYVTAADFDPLTGMPEAPSAGDPPGSAPSAGGAPSAAPTSSLSSADSKAIDEIIAKLKATRELMIKYEIDTIDEVSKNLMSHEFDGKKIEDVMWPARGSFDIQDTIWKISNNLFGVPFNPADPKDTENHGPAGRPETPAMPGVLQIMNSPTLKQHMKMAAADGKINKSIHKKALDLEGTLGKMSVAWPTAKKDPTKGSEWPALSMLTAVQKDVRTRQKNFDALEKLLGRKDAGELWFDEEFGMTALGKEFAKEVGELIEALGPAQQKIFGKYNAKIDNAGKVFVNDKPFTEAMANEIKSNFKELSDPLVNPDPAKNATNVQAARFIQTTDPMADCGQAIVLKLVQKFTKDYLEKKFKPKTIREIDAELSAEYPRGLKNLFLEIIKSGTEFKEEKTSLSAPTRIEDNNTISVITKNGVEFTLLVFNGRHYDGPNLIRALKDLNIRKADFDEILQADPFAAAETAYKATIKYLFRKELENNKAVSANHSESAFASSKFFPEIESSMHASGSILSRLLRLAGIKVAAEEDEAEEGGGKITLQRQLDSAKKMREISQKRLNALMKDPDTTEAKQAEIERFQSQIALYTRQILDYESEMQQQIDSVSEVASVSRWTEGYDMPPEILAAISNTDAKPASVNMMMNVVLNSADFGGNAANIVTGAPFTSNKSFPGKGDDYGITFHNYDSKTKTVLGTDFTGARKKLLIEDITRLLDGPKENITEENLLQIRDQVLVAKPVAIKKKLKAGEQMDSESIIQTAKEHLELPVSHVIASKSISKLRMEQLFLEKLAKNLNRAIATDDKKTPEQAQEMTAMLGEISSREKQVAEEIKNVLGDEAETERSEAENRQLRVEQRIYDKFGEMGLVRQLLELDEDKEENIKRAEKNLETFANIKDYVESNKPQFIQALEKAKRLIEEEEISLREKETSEEFK